MRRRERVAVGRWGGDTCQLDVANKKVDERTARDRAPLCARVKRGRACVRPSPIKGVTEGPM
eukprot:4592741-Pyramimonas_sp.AAC.1